MNGITKVLVLFTLLLLVAVPAVIAQDEEPAVPPNSISGLINRDNRFDTLAAALEAANLQRKFSGAKWTLFAPTDEAFAKIGLNATNIGDAFSRSELMELFFYHAMRGRNSSADLKTMLGDITMFNGELAGLKYYKDYLYVNDESKITTPNIPADNGFIHGVDTVIQPPWPRVPIDEGTGGQVESAEPEKPSISPTSIAGIAAADGRFDTVIAAAEASGLVDDLAGGEWTAFMPTDEAFAKLGLLPGNIAGQFSQQELADLLLYHLMEGSNSTAELKKTLGNVIMANGQQAGLKFYEDHIYVNDDSMVIEENIVTDNGTIHVVDNVILPPWPRVDEE